MSGGPPKATPKTAPPPPCRVDRPAAVLRTTCTSISAAQPIPTTPAVYGAACRITACYRPGAPEPEHAPEAHAFQRPGSCLDSHCIAVTLGYQSDADLMHSCPTPRPRSCMSRKVLDLGSTASKAHVLKLLANFHLGACLPAVQHAPYTACRTLHTESVSFSTCSGKPLLNFCIPNATSHAYRHRTRGSSGDCECSASTEAAHTMLPGPAARQRTWPNAAPTWLLLCSVAD